MARKRKPPEEQINQPSNAAKARRQERVQTQRAKTLHKGEVRDLEGMLKKFSEGIKKAVEKRQAQEAFKHFSMPVEDQAVHTFSIPAPLTKPEEMYRRNDRLQWYWHSSGCTVVATLIMQDGPNPDEWGVKHGTRAGEWVVDVIGPGGSACFQLNADQAKEVGELTLSAVYWRFAYLEYMEEYLPEEENPSDGEVIQIYEKDQ